MEVDLSVQKLTKQFGDTKVVKSVSFEVKKGNFFSILGPSGCGKTTLMRMIAGFLEHDSGDILIRGKNMAGVSPNKRPVNLVFQNLALFPMMDVAENIAFGLKRRGEQASQIQAKVDNILERVHLPGFGKKRINQLSGGQKQRIAIARCLVLEPTVLLLDEPLGALDLKLREQMKIELKSLQTEIGTTFLYITHDQSEALVMSDHVAVMNNGIFQQVDTPQNLYTHPKNAFVAQFVGENNSWSGKVKSQNEQGIEIDVEGTRFFSRFNGKTAPGEDATLYVRPEAMLINPDAALKDINRLNATVKSILFDGANSHLLILPDGSKKELLIALPQNKQFDHIRAKDQIEVGWDGMSSICFKDGEAQ